MDLGNRAMGLQQKSTLKILYTAKTKIIRMIIDSPCYISNYILHAGLKIPLIADVIKIHFSKYRMRNV